MSEDTEMVNVTSDPPTSAGCGVLPEYKDRRPVYHAYSETEVMNIGGLNSVQAVCIAVASSSGGFFAALLTEYFIIDWESASEATRIFIGLGMGFSLFLGLAFGIAIFKNWDTKKSVKKQIEKESG